LKKEAEKMKYYQNTTNTAVAVYDIKLEIGPGKVISISDETASQSVHLQQFLAKGILKEVEEGTAPLTFPVGPVSNVVLPDGVKPEERELAPTVADTNELGQVVVAGNFPGTAEVKNVQDVIKEETTKINEEIKTISEELVKQAEIPQIPEDLKYWFNMRHAQKKFDILHCENAEKLKYIAEYDKNEKVQKLISQRLKELEEKAQ